MQALRCETRFLMEKNFVANGCVWGRKAITNTVMTLTYVDTPVMILRRVTTFWSVKNIPENEKLSDKFKLEVIYKHEDLPSKSRKIKKF